MNTMRRVSWSRRSFVGMDVRTDLQDDLAYVRTGFQNTVSFPTQCEREVSVEDGAHLSALDQWPDLLVQRPGN
jgi:hypothetical protein